MSLILAIESGTEVCSVAVARDGVVQALRESREGRDHARLVAVFTDELLGELGLSASQLDAVAVSKGPGSYTGLRIGVSFAKGLCYGLNIPLIGVESLAALCRVLMAQQGVEVSDKAVLMPMIDARRMEVFTQSYNSAGEATGEAESKVIDGESFGEIRESGAGAEMIIFGDGAAKCREALPWARYCDVSPSASGVAAIAEERLQRGEVESVAYFEPYYLKEAVVTRSKKRYF